MTRVSDQSRKAQVAAAFGAATGGYDTDAELQLKVATELAERIAIQELPEAPRILEIGCGTGFLSRVLRPRLPGARWLITDLSEPMVARCRRDTGSAGNTAFLVMDGERPCVAGGFDLICASLALQWFTAPQAALAAWSDLLNPGGLLAFSSLARDSFKEWRAAHRDLGLAAGTHDYPDGMGFGRMLPEDGVGRVEIRPVRRSYPNGHAFLTVLKRIGAHLPAEGHRPLPAGALRRLLRRFDGGLTVTYEVAYGLFRKDDAP